MEWIFNQLRERPELAIFLTIFLGFWLGKLRIGKFTLGTVTSVLLVGVLVGQLNIAVPGPIKSVFFLLFLFAVGYKVGPQFFRGLKKDGLPQVGFAVLMCVSVLLVTWLLALMMGYNAGEAAGLLAGSQTISAVIGVAEDTMANMGLDEAQRQSYVNIIPVSYAVTYIFGTAGSAWVLSSIGPKMLGGLEKVKAACKELEAILGMVPMAVGQGEGAEMWRPLGVAVIGGLTVSTILTLILVPVLYCSFAGVGIRRTRKKIKKDRELNDYYQLHKEKMTKPRKQ